MKNLDANKGTSLSFLERFQGKKSTISKQGLIHLFEQHQKKIVNIPININSDIKKINYQSSNNKDILTQRVRDIQRIADSKSQKKDPTSRLSYRTEILKKQPSLDFNEKQDLVLPKIVTRFSSSHQKLLNHNKNDNDNKKNYFNIEKPQKKILGFGKNLDENAIQHLQFLNKLQETLAGLRHKNDRKNNQK